MIKYRSTPDKEVSANDLDKIIEPVKNMIEGLSVTCNKVRDMMDRMGISR